MTYIVTPDGNGFPISFGSVGRFLLMPPINVGLKTLPISSCPNSKIWCNETKSDLSFLHKEINEARHWSIHRILICFGRAQKSKWIWTPSMVLKRWLPISLTVCVLKGLGFSQLWKGKRIPRELGYFEWEAYDLFQQGACLWHLGSFFS